MGNLYIPNSVALRNFDTVFKNNDFIFSDKSVNITFHDKYIAMHPIGLAFYAAIGDFIKENDLNLEGSINPKIRSIPYLLRMGLFHALGFTNFC